MEMSRRFVYPEPGDTMETLAGRIMPDVPGAAQQLLSYNLHLMLRPFGVGAPGEILTTDIVYLDPPQA